MQKPVDILDRLARPAELVLPLEDGSVRCLACAHRCLVKPGRRGVCQVRYNDGGRLMAPWGYTAALQADPIEKKPFFHVYPGARALTFGMLGCDFHCGFCQNWLTSQALRDPESDLAVRYVQPVSPERVAAAARQTGCSLVVSSYNEPLITSEWAVSIFKEAHKAGLKCAFVSNGNATPEALQYLAPYLSAYKIDLKTMQDKHYRQVGGVLSHVIDTIRMAHDLGLWVEVVTLVIPDFNDSPSELMEAAETIAGISRDIPWHVTDFHPDYRMTDRGSTRPDKLVEAAEIGQEAGLNYVYTGNIPGYSRELESTYCPNCRKRLVHRRGYTLLGYEITPEGKCPGCGTKIPGLWGE